MKEGGRNLIILDLDEPDVTHAPHIPSDQRDTVGDPDLSSFLMIDSTS